MWQDLGYRKGTIVELALIAVLAVFDLTVLLFLYFSPALSFPFWAYHLQSKTLMDQYFEHIDKRSQSSKYPPRIRFMLRDLIELRGNSWVPRKSATTEAPVPMQQLRPDDNDPPFANNKRDNSHNNDRDSDSWLSKSQFNYQPNANYNSPLIMNNMYNMNQYNSPGSGNYNNRDTGKYYCAQILLIFFLYFH